MPFVHDLPLVHGRSPTSNDIVALTDLPIWQPNPYRRILILAPHPDDETLAAGGVIAAAQTLPQPPQIRVIVATNGDGSRSTAVTQKRNPFSPETFRQMAIQRQQESLNALAELGVPAADVAFWGFPDGGLEPIWQRHWRSAVPYRSPTTGWEAAQQAVNSPMLPYTAVGLLQTLQDTLHRFQPDVIIMPHPLDAHPDHRALAHFTAWAAAQNQGDGAVPTPDLLAYPMWLQGTPWPKSVRLDRVDERLPARFAVHADTWVRHPVRQLGRGQKAAALTCYQSQKPTLGRLLHSSGQAAQEIFHRRHNVTVPRFSASLPLPPDGRWKSLPFTMGWQRARLAYHTRPILFTFAADRYNLWLGVQLPGRPPAGHTYAFVMRTANGRSLTERQLPAHTITMRTPYGTMGLARFPLTGGTGQALSLALKISLGDHLPLAQSAWLHLTIPGETT